MFRVLYITDIIRHNFSYLHSSPFHHNLQETSSYISFLKAAHIMVKEKNNILHISSQRAQNALFVQDVGWLLFEICQK